MRRIALILILLALGCSATSAQWDRLQSGDLLFVRDTSGMGQAVQQTTGQYTHVALVERCGDSLFIDRDHWMQEAEEAYALWLKMVKDDAEKEYQMGDVESDQLRDFLESIK